MQKNPKSILMRRLHGAGKKLGMDHQALTMAAVQYNVESLSQLSVPQLREYLVWLQNKADQIKPNSRRWSAQDKRIFALGYDLGWDTGSIKKFINHQTGKTSLQKCTIAEKSKVILGMEKIKKGEGHGN